MQIFRCVRKIAKTSISLLTLFTYLFTYFTYLFTYSMQHSPPWEANRSSASQKFPEFYGIRRFITGPISACHLYLTWVIGLLALWYQSVCPSVCTEQLGYQWSEFHETWYLGHHHHHHHHYRWLDIPWWALAFLRSFANSSLSRATFFQFLSSSISYLDQHHLSIAILVFQLFLHYPSLC